MGRRGHVLACADTGYNLFTLIYLQNVFVVNVAVMYVIVS